jgi:imidazole glycerol-phosphate synthase subunit HisF
MPCLLVKDRRLVKTINFEDPKYVGDPINAVKIFNDKEVDELVVLDINASKVNSTIDFELLKDFASECFMPLAYGGGVKNLSDFKKLFNLGIEKIIINTLIFDNPETLKLAAQKFGSQSVVASIDVVKDRNGDFQIFSHSGRNSDMGFSDFLKYVETLNVGEVLITSVDREGTWSGFDENLIRLVNSQVSIPVIANGGCGSPSHLTSILYHTGVQAAAIGSMAVYQKKDMGVLIRFPKRDSIIIDE